MTNEELKKIVGRNVRKYRLIYNAYNKEKLTQKGLAEKIGAKTPLIGALESENNNMGVSIYNLYMISQVYFLTFLPTSFFNSSFVIPNLFPYTRKNG